MVVWKKVALVSGVAALGVLGPAQMLGILYLLGVTPEEAVAELNQRFLPDPMYSVGSCIANYLPEFYPECLDHNGEFMCICIRVPSCNCPAAPW